MKRTQIYLSEAQHEFLRRMAFEQHKSFSQVIRDMVEAFCKEPGNAGASAAAGRPKEAAQPDEERLKVTEKEVKKTIGKVLKSREIDEVKEAAESLRGYVSEDRYEQLNTAIEEYRKSLEELSKFS